MELYIATAVVAAGYMLSGDKKQSDTPLAKVPPKNVPNGDNIFNSNRVQEIRLQQQKMSDKKYQQVFSNKPNGSNLVVPGPTQPYFNKVDYTDNTLPVEFEDNPPRMNVGVPTIDHTQKHYGSGHPTGNPVSDGWYGVSLTGNPIHPKTFVHNNMTPFFGSHVRQNVDEYGGRQIVERFTGQNNFDKRKTEIPQLFDPQANIRNPYGMSNLSGYQRERYIVSNKRNNEAPTEKVYVGPGLNRGYTWCPSGGFQQAETRDYILPKTVDELRVKTNPKLTYNIPVIAGQKPSRPPKIGVVQKNRPDSFAVWTPDRYFITTGDRVKPKQRGEIVLKHSNRTTTDIRRAMGPAGPREGFSQEGIRSNVRISERCQYTPGGPRGVDGAGQWTIPEGCPEETQGNYVPMKKCDSSGYPETNQLTGPRSNDACYTDRRLDCNSIHDYGRSSLCLGKTNREDTSCIPNGNIVGLDQQGYVPITSDLRPTRKQDVVGNARWASNVQLPVGSGVVWDPNDVPRTTTKETLLREAATVNIAAQRPANAPVYDPNDVPRTTIKETLLQEAPTVNMAAQRPANAPVYDPNDIPKTTIKETTLSDGRLGPIHRQEHLRPRAYDPTDVPRTTNKETTMTDYSGNAYLPTEDRRDCNKYEASNTNRQFTSDVQYVGNAVGEQEGGYNVVDIDPRYTNRQYTSDHSYTGTAGNTDNKPRERCMMNNAVTRSAREVLAKGRVPAREGPKDSIDPGTIHATTNKFGDLQNTAYSQRAMMSTKVYNSLPQANDCGNTKNKKTLNNSQIRNRLDSTLLDEFRKNPYSQSLESYWTY